MIATVETSTIIYNIRRIVYSLWEAKVKKVNRSLVKGSAAPITFTASEPYMVLEPRFPTSSPLYCSTDLVERPFVEITISAEVAKVAGYRPLAMLDYRHSEPIIRAWPGEEIGEVPASPQCDHCKTSRNRHQIVLLEQEATGSRFYVGRKCVKDFIGHDPESMLRTIEHLVELEAWSDFSNEDMGQELLSYSRDRTMDIAEILIYATAAIREHGWRGARDERFDYSTATMVNNAMFPRPRVKGDYRPIPVVHVTQEDREQATRSLELVRQVKIDNDYTRNLSIIARDGYCNSKEFNIAVSMARFAQMAEEKELERLEREQLKASLPVSEYVGEVKARVTLEARVEYVKVIASNYGVTTLVKMVTPEGSRLSWFASNLWDADELVGKDVLVVGTVKVHKEFNGVRETQLTRCKLEVCRE